VQAALVIRTTHHLKRVRVTEDLEILLSSRPPEQMNAAQIQAFRRGHWGVEAVHYVRDVTFGEDRSTAHTLHAPQNLATLRHAVIGLCAIVASMNQLTGGGQLKIRPRAANEAYAWEWKRVALARTWADPMTMQQPSVRIDW